MSKIISNKHKKKLIQAIDWRKNIDEMIFNPPYDIWYFFEGGPGYNKAIIYDAILLANTQLLQQPTIYSFNSPLVEQYEQHFIRGETLEEMLTDIKTSNQAYHLIEGTEPSLGWRTESNEDVDWLSHSRGLDQGELGILAFRDKSFAKEFVSLLPEGAFCDQNNLEEHWGWLSIGYGLYSLHPERHWDEPGMDKIISKEQAMILLASDKYKE